MIWLYIGNVFLATMNVLQITSYRHTNQKVKDKVKLEIKKNMHS